jgi:hypothetical protein
MADIPNLMAAYEFGRKDVIDQVGSEEIRQAIRKIMYDRTIQLI